MTMDDSIAARLLSEDRQRLAQRGLATVDAEVLVNALIYREIERERVIRLAAIWAWCGVVVFGILAGLARASSRSDFEVLAEAAGPVIDIIIILAGLALFLALLMTFVWLHRTRGPSPAAIERRLQQIEAALRRHD